LEIIKSLDLEWFWLGYSVGVNSRKRIADSPNKILNLGKQGVKKVPTDKQKVSFFIGVYMGRGKIVQNFDVVKVIQYEKIRVIDIDGNESFVSGMPFINRKDNGELLTPDSGKIVGRIAREDFDYKFRWHDLRHTYATIAANELHVNPNFLKRQMGHVKIETTLKYYTQVSDAVEAESRQLIQGIGVKPYIEPEYDYDFDTEQRGKKLENQVNYEFRNGKLVIK